jgi:hypothetical protein
MPNNMTMKASEKEERCIRYTLRLKLHATRRAQLESESELRQTIQWKKATRPNSLPRALEFALFVPLVLLFVHLIIPVGYHIGYLLYRLKVLLEQFISHRVPSNKSLFALWKAHGIPSSDKKYNYDDIANCISVWIGHLYGESIVNYLDIRTRLDQAKSAHQRRKQSPPGPKPALGIAGVIIFYMNPIDVVIKEISALLPPYS